MSQTELIDETGDGPVRPAAPRPRGALALVGLWRDLDETALEAVVADIYAERARDVGRPVDLD